MMKTKMKQVLVNAAIVALTGPLWVSTSFAASSDADLKVAAQETLSAQMGSDAKDIQIDVRNGVANLSGWANEEAEKSKAQALVSRVPGMHQAYSTVRTWSSNSNS